MALYNLDYPILPGGAARTLMIDADGTLPYPDTSGTEPLAEADTENAGKLLCTVGTMVWNADMSMIAQLGPAGWAAISGTLPDVDEAPVEETPADPGEGGDNTPGEGGDDNEGGNDSEGGEDATEEENNG